jgi:hypothetical protein
VLVAEYPCPESVSYMLSPRFALPRDRSDPINEHPTSSECLRTRRFSRDPVKQTRRSSPCSRVNLSMDDTSLRTVCKLSSFRLCRVPKGRRC